MAYRHFRNFRATFGVSESIIDIEVNPHKADFCQPSGGNRDATGPKSEVLCEGLRLIQDREAQLAALDTVIGRALADSDAGMGKPADEVFDRLDAKYRAMASARK